MLKAMESMLREQREELNTYKIRARFIPIMFIVFLMLFVAGSLTPLPSDLARMLYEQLNRTAYEITKDKDLEILTFRIFINNARVAIMCVIPLVGMFFSFFVMFSTGLGLSAFSMFSDRSRVELLSMTLSAPHTWLEIFSISLVSVESIVLSYLFFKRLPVRKELGITLSILFLSLSVLALAAGIEAMLILRGLRG